MNTDAPHQDDQQSENELLKRVLKAMPVPVSFFNRGGSIVYRSDAFVKTFGYTIEDIPLENEWWLLAYPDEKYREKVRATWDAEIEQAILENRQPHPQEWRVTCKDGTKKDIEFSASIIDDCLLVTFIDVTERRQQEESLRNSELRYKTLAEAVFEGVIISQNGVIIDVSDQYASMLGYTRQELIGTQIGNRTTPESRNDVIEAISMNRTTPYECTLIKANGELIDVLVRGKSLQIGNDSFRVSVLRDLTDTKKVERELRSANSRLRTLIETSPLPIVVFTPDRTISLWNRAAETVYGWNEKEVIGKVAPYIIKEKEDEYNKLYERALSGNEFVGEQSRRIRKDGSIVDISISAVSLRDDLGNTTGVISIGTDITEQIKASEALRHSEAFLNSIVEYSPISTWISDENGTMIRMNRSCRDLFGMDDIDLIGKYNLFRDNIVEQTGNMQLVRNVFEKGEIAKFTFWYDTSQLKHTAASPRYLYLNVTISPVLDKEGKVTNAVVQHVDLTERKHAEEELAVSNKELHIINGIISETAGVSDIKSILEMVLDEALKIVDLEGGMICLLGADDILHLSTYKDASTENTNDTHMWQEEFAEYMYTRCAKTGEPLIPSNVDKVSESDIEEFLKKNNIQFHASFPMMIETKCLGILCVFTRTDKRPTDRSLRLLETVNMQVALAVERAKLFEELKFNADELEHRVVERTLQLENVNRELEAFSYSVSHDLRAPLRSIDGFCFLVLEDYEQKLDEAGKEYLRRVRAAAEKMGEIIDDVLRLSRINRIEMVKSHTDLSKIVDSIASDLTESNPDRKAEFIIQTDLTDNVESNLIMITLANLIENAWKFTSLNEYARIEFGAIPDQGRNKYYVRDNGVGFDQAYAGKLFGEFQRLHTDSAFPGTGIGLATAKRIINRHGGEIWAEGEVGKGAVFYFTLG